MDIYLDDDLPIIDVISLLLISLLLTQTMTNEIKTAYFSLGMQNRHNGFLAMIILNSDYIFLYLSVIDIHLFFLSCPINVIPCAFLVVGIILDVFYSSLSIS